MTLDEFEAHTPSGLAARNSDKWNYIPPGGESYAMAGMRAAPGNPAAHSQAPG